MRSQRIWRLNESRFVQIRDVSILILKQLKETAVTLQSYGLANS